MVAVMDRAYAIGRWLPGLPQCLALDAPRKAGFRRRRAGDEGAGDVAGGGEARNRQALPMSSGCAMRPSGTVAETAAMPASSP